MYENNDMILSLCKEAEHYYKVCVDLGNSPKEFALYLDVRDHYQMLLETLRINNIGGVLINGIFRNLEE